MKHNRRTFIKEFGIAAAGLCFLPSCRSILPSNPDTVGIKKIGLQLYTLRDDMPKDPKGILAQVAQAGYHQIESYEGSSGIWWGMGPKGFRQYLSDLGMEAVSAHCDIGKDFERKAEEAAEVGLKYLVCPWLGKQPNLDFYRKAAEDFNQKGEICRKYGIRFAYHNHAYSFEKVGGTYPQDLMMKETDPALVDFEMDMYWVHAAHENINHWLEKYKGRFKLCHIKDYSKNPGKDDGLNSVDVGKGVINWKDALTTAVNTGMKYFIVEQEAYPGTTPLEAIRANAKYMMQFL